MRSHDSLIQLFDPLFEKLAASSWESVGMNHIWNPRRPIWFQSIIHLIEPHLVPVIKDFLSMVDTGRSWTVNQVSIVMKEIITNIQDIVEIIPIPVLRLCKEIESRLVYYSTNLKKYRRKKLVKSNKSKKFT